MSRKYQALRKSSNAMSFSMIRLRMGDDANVDDDDDAAADDVHV